MDFKLLDLFKKKVSKSRKIGMKIERDPAAARALLKACIKNSDKDSFVFPYDGKHYTARKMHGVPYFTGGQ